MKAATVRQDHTSSIFGKIPSTNALRTSCGPFDICQPGLRVGATEVSSCCLHSLLAYRIACPVSPRLLLRQAQPWANFSSAGLSKSRRKIWSPPRAQAVSDSNQGAFTVLSLWQVILSTVLTIPSVIGGAKVEFQLEAVTITRTTMLKGRTTPFSGQDNALHRLGLQQHCRFEPKSACMGC